VWCARVSSWFEIWAPTKTPASQSARGDFNAHRRIAIGDRDRHFLHEGICKRGGEVDPGNGADGSTAVIRSDGDVVALSERGHSLDFADAVEAQAGPQNIDRTVTQQILEDGDIGDAAAQVR
jgi:hypothetical protein